MAVGTQVGMLIGSGTDAYHCHQFFDVAPRALGLLRQIRRGLSSSVGIGHIVLRDGLDPGNRLADVGYPVCLLLAAGRYFRNHPAAPIYP